MHQCVCVIPAHYRSVLLHNTCVPHWHLSLHLSRSLLLEHSFACKHSWLLALLGISICHSVGHVRKCMWKSLSVHTVLPVNITMCQNYPCTALSMALYTIYCKWGILTLTQATLTLLQKASMFLFEHDNIIIVKICSAAERSQPCICWHSFLKIKHK